MPEMIEVDRELLAVAAAELGTTTDQDTVNAALRFVAGRRERIARILSVTDRFDDPLER